MDKTDDGSLAFLGIERDPSSRSFDPSLPDSEAHKFFTGSTEMLYILREIRKRDAFPRRVTLRQSGNRFFFE